MDSRSYRPEPQAIPDKTGRTVIVAVFAAVLGAILAGSAIFIWQQARVASLKSEVATAKASAQTATAQLSALKTQLEEVTATAAKEEKKAEKEKDAAKEARQAEKEAAKEAEESGKTDLPDGKNYGAFKDVTTKPNEVKVDVQEFLTGDEAKQAAKDAGEEFANDYFIVNQSNKLRTLPVSGDAEVKILKMGGGAPEHKTVSFDDFASMFSNPTKDEKHLTSHGYWFWLEKGEVVKIEEQFTP